LSLAIGRVQLSWPLLATPTMPLIFAAPHGK
jgi:hypothetical protein